MEEREGEKEGREGVSGKTGAQRKKAGEREKGRRCYYFTGLSSSLVVPESIEPYSNFIFNSIPKLSVC